MANINKNIIMQAGAAVANATNKAAGLSAATPEPGAIISVIQLVNGGRTVGPDALAHFTESVRNKLLSLLLSLEPIQDFNGYGHPWPAGGGKNKYSGGDVIVNNALLTKVSIDPIPAGKYTVSAVIGTPVTLCRVSFRRQDGSELDTVAIPYVSGGRSYQTITLSDTAYLIYFYYAAATSGTGSQTYTDIQIESGSSPTSYSPYSNICPLTGRTGANVYVSPTPDVADATTYAANWTTPAGTVYAGSADIVSGDIKAAPYYASYNGETLVGPWVSSMDVYDPEGTPTTGAQVVDLGGAMTEYHITGQDIITLVGDNYIWSDSGDVTITE